MEHLPQGVKDSEGCFVYQFIGENSIAARSHQNLGHQCKTDLTFENGELVSIDLVSPSRLVGSTNGPFLRLSDREGWLFEKKFGNAMMARIPVTVGLWCFVVDNFTAGIALRRHPIDRGDIVVMDVSYEPMQKIYCDRKVKHPSTGVNFYRVQGTEGWVFDRRPSSTENGEDVYMLLEENMVETGLFVYECTERISIRSEPYVSDDVRTDLTVAKGDLVSINVIRQSPYSHGNGPFLRLSDGSGWLFENKHNEQMMRSVPLREAKWILKVVNSEGIALRRQPIDSKVMRQKGVVYKPGTIIECTNMVQASSGVKFYRVKGTEDWIFDKRDDSQMLSLVSEQSTREMDDFRPNTNALGNGWSPDFVRGVATAIEGVSEIDFNERSRVISFRSAPDGVRINVYYTTRTIGTCLSHPSQGATQLFRRDCTNEELVHILENPRDHTGKGYKRRRHDPSSIYRINSGSGDIVQTPHGRGMLADQEAELRNALLEADDEMATVQKRRQSLLERIRDVDLVRAEEAKKMESQVDARRQELRERKQAREEAERLRCERKAEAERAERELRARTCYQCDRVFQDRRAYQQHYDAVHVFRCDYCYKDFNNTHALNQHRDALGHW